MSAQQIRQFSANISSAQDLATGGGYKKRPTRDLHRLWAKAFEVSGIKSQKATKLERDSGKFNDFLGKIPKTQAGAFYFQRIKMGKAFYGRSTTAPAMKVKTLKRRNITVGATMKANPITPASIVKFKSINKQKSKKPTETFNIKNTNTIYGRKATKAQLRASLARTDSVPMTSRASKLKIQRKRQLRASLGRTDSIPMVRK